MKKRYIISAIIGAIVATSIVAKIKNKKIDVASKNSTKYLTLFRQMNQYLITKQMDKDIVSYFEERKIKKIAIYGMSHIAQRIIDDLEDSGVEVLYGIDRRADRLTYDMKIYKPEDSYPEVDAIVVTAYDFKEISEMLTEKMACEIISFSEIIFSL